MVLWWWIDCEGREWAHCVTKCGSGKYYHFSRLRPHPLSYPPSLPITDADREYSNVVGWFNSRWLVEIWGRICNNVGLVGSFWLCTSAIVGPIWLIGCVGMLGWFDYDMPRFVAQYCSHCTLYTFGQQPTQHQSTINCQPKQLSICLIHCDPSASMQSMEPSWACNHNSLQHRTTTTPESHDPKPQQAQTQQAQNHNSNLNFNHNLPQPQPLQSFTNTPILINHNIQPRTL